MTPLQHLDHVLQGTGLTARDVLGMPTREALAIPGVGRKILEAAREEAEVVVVTRHSGLVWYLIEIGLISEGASVLSHATPDDVRGRHVIGVLPLRLAALAALVTEVPLDIPPELRGVELTLEQVRQYAGEPVTYIVDRRRP